MFKFEIIIEASGILEYLEKRNLVKQYKKAKGLLLIGNLKQVDFKLREPKKDGIYYFRINKQFRALCIIKDNELRVFEIDNHQ